MNQQLSDRIEIASNSSWRRTLQRHPRICLWPVYIFIAAGLGITWGIFMDERAYSTFSSAANLFHSSTDGFSGVATPIYSPLYTILLALLDRLGAPLPEAGLAISIIGWSLAALVVYELVIAALQGKSSQKLGFAAAILLLFSPMAVTTLGTEIPWLVVLGGAALLTFIKKDWKRNTIILAALPLMSIGPSAIILSTVLLILRWRESKQFPLRLGLVLAIVTTGCMALIRWINGSIWFFAGPNPASWQSSLKRLVHESELYWLFIPLIAAGLFSMTGLGKTLAGQSRAKTAGLPLWLALWGAGLLLEDAPTGGAVLGATALVLTGIGLGWLVRFALTFEWRQPRDHTAVYLAALSLWLALLIGEGSSLYTRYMMRPTAYQELETRAANWLRAHSEPDSVVLGAARLGYLAERHIRPWNGGQRDEQEVPELTAELIRDPVDFVVSSRTIAWTLLTRSNWFETEYQPLQEYKSAQAVNSPIVIWGPIEGSFQNGEKQPLQVDTPVGASLVGYRVWPESIRPGDKMYVTLYWQAVEPVKEAFHTVLRVITPLDRTAMAQQDIVTPRSIPASWWEPGLVITEQYQLDVPPDIDAGAFEVNVSLRMPRTNDLLPMHAGNDPNPVDRIVLGYVSAPWEGVPPAGAIPVQAAFGDRIQLESVLLENGLTAGGIMKVTCFWQALAQPEQDYTVFIHLVNREGVMISSHDSLPMNGAYTTLAWLAGDLIPDEHTLALPDTLPPSPYKLRIGLYLIETGERPAVSDSQGEIPDGFVTIPID